MGRRKIPFHQSPSQRYAAEVAERQRITAIRERAADRRAERRARLRAERALTAAAPALRVIKSVLRNPSPAGLDRLARFCGRHDLDEEVRLRAARAILRIAHGAPPKVQDDDGKSE